MELKKRGKYILNLTLEKIFNNQNLKYDGFKLDTYIYTPDSLFINSSTLTINEFLKNTSIFTRLKTPPISLKAILNEKYKDSPINFLKKKKEWGLAIDKSQNKCIYEMKTLVNIVRHHIYMNLRDVEAKIKNEKLSIDLLKKDLSKIMDEFFQNTKLLILEMEDLSLFFLQTDNTSEVKNSFSLALEALIIELENVFVLIQAKFQRKEYLKEFYKDEFAKILNYLDLVGKKYCMVSILKNNDKNEARHFLYRINELKKWSQNTLYIPISKSKVVAFVEHFFLGIAAVIAMIFSLVASIFSMKLFPSWSFYWIIMAIISYLFKDRIKDLLKPILILYAPKIASNRIYKIFDISSKISIGVSREKVNFLKKEKVPENIFLLRNNSNNLLADKKESILHYSKDLKINLKPFFQNHKRLHGITEIIRFDLREWFKKMDDSNQQIAFWNKDEKKSGFIYTDRVYHINFIFRTSNLQNEGVSLSKHRITCSRKGIIGIKKV